MNNSESPVQFVPFSSFINTSFWTKFTTLKLDVLRLDESAKKIWGYYSNFYSRNRPILEVESISFNRETSCMKFNLPYHGLLINKNTIEEFKACDKKQLIQNIGKILEDDVKTGRAVKQPSLLNLFFILSYADLKNYKYYYWFAFPALSNIKPTYLKSYIIGELHNKSELDTLYKQYDELDIDNKTYFLVESKSNVKVLTFASRISTPNNLGSVNDFDNILIAFSDSPSQPGLGWPLRNLILLLLYHCPCLQNKVLKFLSFRLNRQGSEINCSNSIVWEIRMPNIDKSGLFSSTEASWIGFEPNERDKMGPRLSNMKESMAPQSLVSITNNLNLKLMKWRLVPDLDLDKLTQTKCLLLGSGTLGCAVARDLLAWGVTTITFVDGSNVGYGNPVRQNLYTFEDSMSNKPKATTAAENLGKVSPCANTSGHELTIPMPGHPIGESLLAETKESYEKLKGLIEKHDIIFLLMDSRESRWLPTVICTSLKKITINAALGFDTYLVMRHGVNSDLKNEVAPSSIPDHLKCIPGNKLGCYFCNDITAPGDSLKDRTLDQQCTVTRPGVSNIAAALAVELAVSLTQHEKGALAPAYYTTSKHEDVSRHDECNLGIIPHSIRGFLSMFNHVLPATERYNQCIACSDIVIKLYEEKGFDFLLEVFQDSSYLEKVTGLDKMYKDWGELEEMVLSEAESA